MLHRALLYAISLVLAVAVVFSDIQPGYLDFDNLPETNFSCEGKVIGGYYADVETGCQMFHVCTIGQKGEISDIKFLCLNGTVFDQETRVCERIDEVECDKSEDFFNLNLELYGNTASFGTHDCGDDDCGETDDDEEEDDEDDGSEYDDDDIETTTLLTTTTTTVRTTTTRPTTIRTTVPPTQARTHGYTRYTTQGPQHDSISALLALHNAFNQGLNRRPILSPVSTTRIPSTTTRRPTIGLTLRSRFSPTDSHHRHDHGYLLRPRPTYTPSFTSSIQTPLKSNYHTFESGDTQFAHSFDPDKPYHFQYFAQKSSPSPFSVRIEPEVSVVTSTSTSTSIRIANATIDEFPYDDYDSLDPFFHDVQKITRPKRSTTQRSSSRVIKSSELNKLLKATLAKNISNSTDDHVIKIDQSDVFLSKNYSAESTEQKNEYLNNLLDSIAMEDTDKKQVLDLIRNSEPEMEQLLDNDGVNMMLEKLENKLLEIELEGSGAGMPFQFEGDSYEIREKRGSDNKSTVGNIENFEYADDDNSDEFTCINPEFCIDKPGDDVLQFQIEDSPRRSAKTRVKRESTRSGRRKVDLQREDDFSQSTTESHTLKTTKKSRRKIIRVNQSRSNSAHGNRRVSTYERVKPSITQRPDIKPVTEEIEGDITTAEYRRSPLPHQNKLRPHHYPEATTPYTVLSSTRLQTRFDYNNQKKNITTKRTTQKPTYYRHVPVHEDDDYPEIIEISKQQRRTRRSPTIVKDDLARLVRTTDEEETINFESAPIRRSNKQSIRSEINTGNFHTTRIPSRSRSRQRPQSVDVTTNEQNVDHRSNTHSTRSRSRSRNTPRRNENQYSSTEIADIEPALPSLPDDNVKTNYAAIINQGTFNLRDMVSTNLDGEGLNKNVDQFVNYKRVELPSASHLNKPTPDRAQRQNMVQNNSRTIEGNRSNRRRKVVRNRVQPDRSPEVVTYTNEKIEQSKGVEETTDAVITSTQPVTPYTPEPGVEADPNFSCRGKVKGGYYADVYSECHGFFICSQAKRGIVATHFWCGVGTKFNQKSRTCQSAAQVDCSISPRLYHLNDNQYDPSVDIEEKLRGSFEPMRV